MAQPDNAAEADAHAASLTGSGSTRKARNVHTEDKGAASKVETPIPLEQKIGRAHV